jgi:hypothetical protein
MANKMLSLSVMGSLSLILFTMLSFATIGQSYPGPVWLWTGWVASLALTAFVLWQAETLRSACGYLSLIGGVISFVLVLVILFVPVSASAPYEPGADWLRTIDLTPPIVVGLRVALTSAYFATTVVVLGAILLSAAYLLLHFRGPPRRHLL